ncbi:magnesium transporter CorA family protein [Candidatus Parcubacteria bacterium]|jgi:magnesium transporter|nr:magnesium transporter CorA family protein [Candidatus Parcubacteria bacterium]MBT3948773.1 magnesium transporter CorA family protein [Candidatus Parcubacteria bacterium]
MSVKEIKQGDLTWVNISKVNEESIDYLKKNFKFHHLDLEDIQSESQNPKLDAYKTYLFLVLHFPQWKSSSKKIVPHEVDMFVGDNYVITIQHGKNKEIKNFFYRCMNNRKIKADWMNKSSGYLLYKLLESLYGQTRPTLSNIGKQISGIENEIFAGEQDLHAIRQLALHRRNVLSFRRILDPQRYLVSTLSHTRKTFMDESMSIYFDDVKDYLDKLWVIADSYKETIEGLHLTVESLINQKTNKVIGALTVMSAALLPLTLLSGIYGMNIIELPYAQDPKFVWALFGGLTVFILLVIFIMKKKKWL